MPASQSDFFRLAFATLIGAAIPAMVFGRVIFATILVLGFLALLASNLHRNAWLHLLQQARQPLGILVLITVAVWSISAMGSSFPVRSLEATLRTGFFVAVAVMVHAALSQHSDLQLRCMKAFVVSGAVVTILAVVETLALPDLYWALRLKGWLAQPLHSELKAFSSLAVLLVPLFVLAGWQLKGSWLSLAFLAIIGFTFLIWENYNRAAMAGILVVLGAVAVVLLLRRRSRVFALGAAATLALGGISVVSWLAVARQDMVGRVPDSGWAFPLWLVDFQRQTIWKQALDIWEKAPLLGVGANTINFDPSASRPLPGNESLHIIPAHPHNWFVEILAETGIIGLVTLLAAVILAFALFALRYRNSGCLGALTAFAIMAGYWGSGLFNFSYWSAWWQASFLLALALSLGAWKMTENRP